MHKAQHAVLQVVDLHGFPFYKDGVWVVVVPQQLCNFAHTPQVRVNGKQIWRSQIPRYYFAMNKPKGYICSAKALYEHERTAISLMNDWLEQWNKDNPEVRSVGHESWIAACLLSLIAVYTNDKSLRCILGAESYSPIVHRRPTGCAVGGAYFRHE